MTSQRAVAVHNVSVCRNVLPVSVRVQRTCNTIGEPKYSLRAQHGQNPVWSLPVGSKFHTVLCGIMKPHQISFCIWFVTDSSIIVQLLSALNQLSKSALLSLPKICARQKDSSKQNSTHKIKSRVQSSCSGTHFQPGVSGPYQPTFFRGGRISINERHKTPTIPPPERPDGHPGPADGTWCCSLSPQQHRRWSVGCSYPIIALLGHVEVVLGRSFSPSSGFPASGEELISGVVYSLSHVGLELGSSLWG